MNRPSITPAQIVGLLVAGLPVLANLLRAFGVYDLTAEQEAALTDTLQWAAIVAGALFVSDAALRVGRNVGVARGAPVESSPQSSVRHDDPGNRPGPGR
jgi:hypothetical protein